MKYDITLDEDMDWTVDRMILRVMKAQGNPFEVQLARLFEVADQPSRNKLVRAFTPVFQKFEEIANKDPE